MSKSLSRNTIIGIILTGIVGTLLHFVYQWSGETIPAALFSAVNESTWEHLKLLFFPSLVLFLIEYFLTKREMPGLLTRRIQGLVLGLAFIPVAYYTYVGVIGYSYMAVDVILFFIAVFITWIGSQILYQKSAELRKNSVFWIFILFFLLFLFVIFTFRPPHITLFMDPTDFTFGIPQK